MKIISVKDIARKDVPIYYRLVYTAVATIEIAGGKTDDYGVEFSIEIKPTGEKEILVSLRREIHYPLLPVVRELRALIDRMHSAGEIPVV